MKEYQESLVQLHELVELLKNEVTKIKQDLVDIIKPSYQL